MIDENWIFADLHIHSRFSRACSSALNFGNLVKWAKIKGLNLLGTGDFTHPIWMQEIKKLKSNGKGFYYFEDFPFVITGEVSLMYSQSSNPSSTSPSARPTGRKVHLNLLIPSIEVADKINSYLDTKGRRDYDGRPIFKISCEEFTKEIKKISDDVEIIPAHIWTPYFGVFGSMSGFDSLKEAFGDEVEKIFAIETGISSDPEMNWKIKELEDKSIVSFSDAHSFWPWRLGREATIFEKTDSYSELVRQIRENDFIGTVEADPAYGKYHWDGHRLCGFSCSPSETEKLNGICPKCGKQLIIGVENRIESLASSDKKTGKMFYKILPLHEIISMHKQMGVNSKGVWNIYNKLLEKFGNEFNILLEVSREKLLEEIEENLADLILKNRSGKIKVKPGYDGVYGEAVLEGKIEKQGKLF